MKATEHGNSLPPSACPQGREERTLALAAGDLKSREERLEAFTHMVLCEYCREIYDEYPLLQEFLEKEQAPASRKTLEIRIEGDYIFPAPGAPLLQPQAAVLSERNTGVADFLVETEKATYELRVLCSHGAADIEIKCTDETMHYYLIGPKGYTLAHSYEGIVRFERIVPGNYALSRDLLDFVFLTIHS